MNEDRRMGQALLRRWWLVALLVLMGAGVGYVSGAVLRPAYESTTSILVGPVLRDPELTVDDIEASQQLALTYADVLRRQPILQAVVEELGLEGSWRNLLDDVQVSLSPDNPQLILVAVRSGSAEEAAEIAEEIADQLIALKADATAEAAGEMEGFVGERLASLEREIRRKQQLVRSLERELPLITDPVAAENLRLQIESNQRLIIAWQDNYSSLVGLLETGETSNDLEILERAEVNPTPVVPNVPLNTLLAAGVGLFLAVGIVYLWELRARTRVADPDGSSDRQPARLDGRPHLLEDGPHPYVPRHRAQGRRPSTLDPAGGRRARG